MKCKHGQHTQFRACSIPLSKSGSSLHNCIRNHLGVWVELPAKPIAESDKFLNSRVKVPEQTLKTKHRHELSATPTRSKTFPQNKFPQRSTSQQIELRRYRRGNTTTVSTHPADTVQTIELCVPGGAQRVWSVRETLHHVK